MDSQAITRINPNWSNKPVLETRWQRSADDVRGGIVGLYLAGIAFIPAILAIFI